MGAYSITEISCIYKQKHESSSRLNLKYIDNSSLVTHPPKSSKTVVALLRQGQKVVPLLHIPIFQTIELLSRQQKRDSRTPPVSRQHPRNPLISSLFMCLYPTFRDSSTTVSTCTVPGNKSTQHPRSTRYPLSCISLRSLARLVGLQEIYTIFSAP